ncbi:TetR/AcrR family transcriptional regulator [Ammonicoccus fulvus]|uniref:TetR/AcrR family transcriptional regulator n=1 Tax=Ammonicoccus fulvus TaxID=3138240 RepID=A0ABZ3FPB7_9ACTN
MPKIEAATVAEHRAMKARQVIDAAVDLLVGEGPSAVTPAAVAERSGLARTSVYQYAGSAAELVAAAVEALFVRATNDLSEAVAAAGSDPGDRIAAIVRAVLAGAKSGHSPNHAIEVEQLPPAQRERLGQLHGALMAPLVEAIADFGADDPRTTAALAWGAINGIVPMVEGGMPIEQAAARAVAFVSAGVGRTPVVRS